MQAFCFFFKWRSGNTSDHRGDKNLTDQSPPKKMAVIDYKEMEKSKKKKKKFNFSKQIQVKFLDSIRFRVSGTMSKGLDRWSSTLHSWLSTFVSLDFIKVNLFKTGNPNLYH